MFEESSNHLSQINETESPREMADAQVKYFSGDKSSSGGNKASVKDVQFSFVTNKSMKSNKTFLPFKLDFNKNKTSLNNSRKR
jgi:hypothetical protein